MPKVPKGEAVEPEVELMWKFSATKAEQGVEHRAQRFWVSLVFGHPLLKNYDRGPIARARSR
jgi:hypothetical protein